jgi:hypothetical protein
MRIGKSVWHARRINDTNAEIAEYEKPVEIITRPNYLTIMPASSRGYLEMLQSGEMLQNTWIGTANGRVFDGAIKAGDVMWLDGESPIENIEETYGYGASATAEVKSVSEVNLSLYIRLERKQDQVKE